MAYKFRLQEYCEACPEFIPTVIEWPTNLYADNVISTPVGDTVVGCINSVLCSRIRRCISGKKEVTTDA